MIGGNNKETKTLQIVLYVAVALATLWNIRENHKIRKLQKKELEKKVGKA